MNSLTQKGNLTPIYHNLNLTCAFIKYNIYVVSFNCFHYDIKYYKHAVVEGRIIFVYEKKIQKHKAGNIN